MDIEKVFEWLGKLNGLPGCTLITLFCCGVCAGLYKWHKFPSDGIWLCSILLGAVGNSMIADPLSDSLSLRVWLAKNVVVGGICGGIAYVIHIAALKRLLAKLGVNGGNTEFLEKDPSEKPKE